MPQPSKADSPAEVEPRRDLLREARLAVCASIRWIPPPRRDAEASAEEHARALVFVPLLGLIVGVALALCDRVLGALLPPFATSAAIILLGVLITGALLPMGFARAVAALIAGRSPQRTAPAAWIGTIGALLMLAAETLALSALISPPARARALVLAMLLSRWAIVPIGYGLKPLEEDGLGIAYFGGIRFAEFGLASAVALGLAMGLYDVVGLAAIVAVALAILGLRLLMSRRLGGAGGNELAAGAAVCELVTLAIAAAISSI